MTCDLKGTSNRHTNKTPLIAIVCMNSWFLFTNIPYLYFNMKYWTYVIKQENNRITIQLFMLQAISTIFFNVNHCLRILVFMFFKDFRKQLVHNLIAIFSFNPFMKISNPTVQISLLDRSALGSIRNSQKL